MINNTYIGTVIANDDPERAGRVKVRIEGVTTPLGVKSVSYKFPTGKNIVGGLSKQDIDVSRISSVWALVAAPLMGESSMGRYNRKRDVSTNSDFTNPDNMTGGAANPVDSEGRETPPAAQYGRLSDGFDLSTMNTASKTNPYAFSYIPEKYSNAGRGVYGIPAIGSKVLVGFLNGSARQPIVFGKINTQTEFNQVFDSGAGFPSYPGVFENTSSES